MPDTSGSVDLGNLSTEEQEALAKIAEETGTSTEEPNGADNVLEVDLAFTVVVKDGEVGIASPGQRLDIGHYPHQDEIFGACSTIIKDLNAIEAAKATVELQMQQMQHMQQQMQTQAIQQRLAREGKI